MQRFIQKNHLLAGLITACLIGANVPAYADQPAGVAWEIVDSAREGTASPGETPKGDSMFYVQFKPWDLKQENPLLVIFDRCGQDPETVGKPILNFDAYMAGKESSPVYSRDWKTPDPRWRLCPFEADSALVFNDGSSNTIIPFEVDFLRLADEGMSPRLDMAVYEVSRNDLERWPNLQDLTRHYRNQAPAGRVPLQVHYRLSKERWQMGSYEDIYGNPSFQKVGKPTSIYDSSVANVMPVNLESFRRKASIPSNTKFDRLSSLDLALKNAYGSGSGKEGDKICYAENPPRAADESTTRTVPAGMSHQITGRFSTKWSTDHSLHSGFGFRVEVYRVSNNSLLGSAWVQSSGNWTVNVPLTKGFTGGSIKVNYLSYNSYYAPQNQAGSKYWWQDPIWNVTSAEFNVGHRFADTDGGSYNGVGELVDNAMTMWSRLYWSANINPVPAAPIKFFFPNTWENCGGSSPWSCATFAGDQIWLIAAHGVQGDVVNHEMGHALQSKFWQGKAAANSGGSHSLDGCYPTRLGMALGEGFANFMAAWVGYPNRNLADGGFNSGRWALGWDAEQRTPPPNCTNGWENEVWVARTFWDLHDTHADGDDILWFIHPGAVISLFLGNGVANNGDARDMRYYEDIYRNAASAGHQGFITDIFEQNRQ